MNAEHRRTAADENSAGGHSILTWPSGVLWYLIISFPDSDGAADSDPSSAPQAVYKSNLLSIIMAIRHFFNCQRTRDANKVGFNKVCAEPGGIGGGGKPFKWSQTVREAICKHYCSDVFRHRGTKEQRWSKIDPVVVKYGGGCFPLSCCRRSSAVETFPHGSSCFHPPPHHHPQEKPSWGGNNYAASQI